MRVRFEWCSCTCAYHLPGFARGLAALQAQWPSQAAHNTLQIGLDSSVQLIDVHLQAELEISGPLNVPVKGTYAPASEVSTPGLLAGQSGR